MAFDGVETMNPETEEIAQVSVAAVLAWWATVIVILALAVGFALGSLL